MSSSIPRRSLAAAAAVVFLSTRIAASQHRRSVPPFQIQPTHQISAKSMSGLPSLSWPNAHANETYIALGLEMPIVGTVDSDPELIFLGAESYLLFMQDGMTTTAYNHLNISDNLLSSSADPLVSFDEPSGLSSESPFPSSSKSGDLRLLAVLLYKSHTQSQSVARRSSSSPDGALSEIANLLDGETQETGVFNWNAWADDMNANPLLRMDFDIGDFAAKAGLGAPVAAEFLIVKNEAELTDSSASLDIVSTLYQAGAGGNPAATSTTTGAAASGMGAPMSGISPAATGAGEGGGASGLGLIPPDVGAGSGFGPAATGPEASDNESEDNGAGPVIAPADSGTGAGSSQYTDASPTGSGPSTADGDSSGGLVVIPVASTSAAGAANTGSPLNSTGPDGASDGDGGSDDPCDDDGSDSLGAGVSASGGLPSTTGLARAGALSPSGIRKQPKYPFPQFSIAGGGVPSLVIATAVIGQVSAAGTTTPTGSAATAGITGGAATIGEEMTIDINIDGEFDTRITADLKNRNARRTVDAKPGWTLTLKTDLVAPTSRAVPTSTPNNFPRNAYRHESSTLLTTAIATGFPSASGSASASSFMSVSSAGSSVMAAQALSVFGVVCLSLLVVVFL